MREQCLEISMIMMRYTLFHEIQLSQNDECEGVEVSTEKNNVLFHGQGAVHGRDNQK